MKAFVYLIVFCLALSFVSAADYELNSVTGVWTDVDGGSGITGLNTNNVRWGSPAETYKSGLKFDSSSSQSFNEGETFLLGTLTHNNWPVYSGTASDGATLKIDLEFSTPAVTPNPSFTFDFDIEETTNTKGQCAAYQISGTPCDDKVTFPQNYGQESYQIGDKLYTVKILGFVDSYPSGSPVSQFITEEEKDNEAYLVGTLSSVLVEAPQLTLVSKLINGQDIPLTLYVGDPITWEYLVQNTGNVALTDVKVTDDMETVNCPKTTLAAGEAMTCTASSTATLGDYQNTAIATAKHASDVLTTSEKQARYTGIEHVKLYCGDGIVNNAEQCDNGDANGQSCAPEYASSCDYCDDSCNTQTLNGPYCGDNTVNGQEECDGAEGCTGCKWDNSEIPEFGVFAGTVALIGALAAFLFLRKK